MTPRPKKATATNKRSRTPKEQKDAMLTFLGPEWTRRWEGDGFLSTYPKRYQHESSVKEATMKLYHFPIQACPHCHSDNWQIPYIHDRLCEKTYWHPDRQMHIAVTDDWKCLTCGKYVTLDTRTGHLAFTRGLFGVKRLANPMFEVGGWGNAVFETVMIVSLAIIFGSILLRMIIA